MNTNRKQEIAGLLNDNIIFESKAQQYDQHKFSLIRVLIIFILILVTLTCFAIWIMHPNLSLIEPTTPIPSNSSDLAILNKSYTANPLYNCASYNCKSGYVSESDTWIEPTFMSNDNKMKLHYQQNQQLITNPCKYIFIGDSITYKWNTDVFKKYFGFNQSVVYAISGITSHDVGWRLNQGDGFDAISTCLKHSNNSGTRRIILLISTNDIGQGLKVKYVINDYKLLVQQLTKYLVGLNEKAVILYLIGVFPRADIWPSDDTIVKWDSSNKYFDSINYVNKYIQSLAHRNQLVQYIDCNKYLLNENGTLSSDIFYDMLHPTAAGYEIFANCILDDIKAKR